MKDKFNQITDMYYGMGAPAPSLPAPALPPNPPSGGGIPTTGTPPSGEPKGAGQPTTMPAQEEPQAPSEEPTKGGDMLKGVDASSVAFYGIGALVGGAAGYFVAKKHNKNIYGGIFLGGGIGAGAVWLVVNRNMILAKVQQQKQTGK